MLYSIEELATRAVEKGWTESRFFLETYGRTLMVKGAEQEACLSDIHEAYEHALIASR